MDNVTRNQDRFVDCPEISVIVKHVQHVGIIRVFCLSGGTW